MIKGQCIQAAYPDDKEVKSKIQIIISILIVPSKRVLGLIIYFELCQIILLFFKVYIKH